MKNSKFYLILVLLFLPTFFMGGCSTAAPSPPLKDIHLTDENPSQKQQTTLSLTFSGRDLSWISAVEKTAQDFMNLHPDIVLDIDKCTNGIYSEYLNTKEALGEFPDLFEIQEPATLMAAGRLGDFPEEISKLTNEPLRMDGKCYALPIYSNTYGIIYNKQIFERLHLELPQNYQDFLDICEKLKRSGITPIAFSGSDLWHFGYWLNYFFITDVLDSNPDWLQDRNQDLVSFTDEQPIQMLTDYKNLFDSGYIIYNYMHISDSQLAAALVQENAAMLYSGPFMFPLILKADEAFPLGWFFLPDKNGDINAINARESFWSISKECREDSLKSEAAYCFLEYFYQSDVYRNVLQTTNTISTTKRTVLYPSIEVHQQLRKEYLFSNQVSNYIGDFHTPQNFTYELYEIINDMAADKITINEGAAMLDRKWNENQTR
ncbi:Multiple sugar-binding protein [Blautia producta]|uniref:Multiple sugar-binding protein n=1 Tax=Blautia producta TaxID=33035 RepID=A0A4V0Z7J0_9FIRM|nr:ABC transporter substrate-binding protein [Blautia producta]QBE96968.1 Multiple sugar-binding protein [Blautia producta]